MRKLVDDPRVANPGDEDLDLHLSGLMIAGYVVYPHGDGRAEFTVTFDTALAAGWWLTPMGNRFIPERVLSSSAVFGLSGRAAAGALWRLRTWQEQGRLLAQTSAPGKFTLLCTDGPAGYQMMIIPRGITGAWRAAGERDQL